jgi:dihydrofolate synthase/folylpolyglutamate synthase
MSYRAAIDQLHAMVPELYTAAGVPRRKFSLDEIGVLLGALGNPQASFPSVLIAGTNGKGSTASTLASILTASGVRTGLYTSPHLARVNERIRVNGAEIADDAFARLYFKVDDAAQRLVLDGRLAQLPSFFEVLTALALLHFAETGVEMAVLEVGMGGRLDATNIVDPLLSIITDIALDHMEWLGSTLGAIAREKAGILRRGGVLIMLPQHPEVNQVLGEVAAELGVRGVNTLEYMPAEGADAAGAYRVSALGGEVLVDSPLQGPHQHRNIALAIAAAVELAGTRGLAITPESMEAGIRQTSWPGRLEHIRRGAVEWILVVAHNPAGAWALRAGLRDALSARRKRTLVFSCLRDKSVHEMSQILFPLFDQVIVAPIHSARAASLMDLEAAAEAVGVHAAGADSVSQALEMARQRTEGGIVVVCGSVYLVGEARSLLLAEGTGQ